MSAVADRPAALGGGGPTPIAPGPHTRLALALGAGATAAAFAIWQAKIAGYVIPGALRSIGRTGLGALAFWAVCGLAPSRLLLPVAARPFAALMTLAVGLVASSLELTLLGLGHVPFQAALWAVIAVNLVAIVALRAWTVVGRSLSDRGATGRLLWPVYLAALIAAIVMLPVLRAGFATIIGQNGDVVLAAGSAELVRHAPPTAVRPDLPVDRIPLAWRSKYPIFYALAAVAELSGLNTIQAFPTLAATLLAVAAFGFLLFAYLALGAPWPAALLVMALVGVDRILVHVTIHPYYNQLWATVALPFMLLTLWWYVREPSRPAFVLALLWLAAGLFAYPLIVPFPLLFVLVAGWWTWRERRAAGEPVSWWSALRMPGGRMPPWASWAGGLVALLLAATLVRGVFEKAASAIVALSPWGDLSAWTASTLGYVPLHTVLGLPRLGSTALTTVASGVVLALAAWGVARTPRHAAVPFGALLAAGLLGAIYLRVRNHTELFFFKDMGFTGPLVVCAAAIGIADLLRRAGRVTVRQRLAAALGVLALGGVVVGAAVSVRREISQTYEYVNVNVLALKRWSARLPPGRPVRLDIEANGWQLWASYMLADRPLCTIHPFPGFFPAPPVSVRADYALTYVGQGRPAGAVGASPMRSNVQFELWRLRPDLPGPNNCSRRMVDAITSVPIT